MKATSTIKSRRTSKPAAIIARNERWIPGGVISLNRRAEPHLCFTRGKGSRVWDADGNEYIDYQAAFSAMFLGHNDPDVNEAVTAALRDDRVLMGTGPTDREGECALESGLNEVLRWSGRPFHVASQGSALCVYFMDHAPVDYHDLVQSNDAAFDKAWRVALIERGIFQFPVPSKQASVSYAHSDDDIAKTIEAVADVTKILA